MTQYVKITKASGCNCWYKDAIGCIYPVIQQTYFPYQWQVCGDLDEKAIYKCDCKPCQFPSLQEDQHLITTHQLQCLKQMVLDEHEHLVVEQLKEWFPAVFAPAKTTTYKVGDRFVSSEHPKATYDLVHIHSNKVGLLVDGESFWACDGYKEVHAVADPDAITEKELRSIIGLKGDELNMFTKLPDTTDQLV